MHLINNHNINTGSVLMKDTAPNIRKDVQKNITNQLSWSGLIWFIDWALVDLVNLLFWNCKFAQNRFSFQFEKMLKIQYFFLDWGFLIPFSLGISAATVLAVELWKLLKSSIQLSPSIVYPPTKFGDYPTGQLYIYIWSLWYALRKLKQSHTTPFFSLLNLTGPRR